MVECLFPSPHHALEQRHGYGLPRPARQPQGRLLELRGGLELGYRQHEYNVPVSLWDGAAGSGLTPATHETYGIVNHEDPV